MSITGHRSTDDLVIVSIVGYKNADDIECCLEALARSTYTNFVVSLCENGGEQAFETLVQRLESVASPSQVKFDIRDQRIGRIWTGVLRGGNQPIHLLQANTNLGYAGGVNVTLQQFSDDTQWTAVWLLNPDAEPEPGALSALSQRARETNALIVGGRLVFQDTGRVQLYGGRWRRLIARGYNIGLGNPKDAPVEIAQIERAMNYVNGASMYVTRKFVNKIGPMDEDYFLYCEEVDWCLRINPSRLRYAHDCVVYHRHGASMGSNRVHSKRSDLSVYLGERNKLLLSRRFYPKLYPVILLITLVLILQYVIDGSFEKINVAFRGWLAGLRGETGAPRNLIGPK